MGADIYLHWDKQTEEEKQKQITGYDITKGHVGYLRGAYNGHVGWDAICMLFEDVKEFDQCGENWVVNINLLKQNLKQMEETIFVDRKKDFFSKDGKDSEIQSYRDFVKLAGEKIKERKKPFVRFSC